MMDWVTTAMVRTLMRMGNLAALSNRNTEAMTIYEAVSAARPKSEIPYVGMATAHIDAGNFSEAIRILRDKALVLSPGNPSCKVFLGLALKMNGETEAAQAILREVTDNTSSDESTQSLAQSVISETITAPA